ncbi:MAG: hypothetical protein H8E98_03970 [Bacteroidetes bacterium]|nr:hypothetical protein [Bacteroidota bacterium]
MNFGKLLVEELLTEADIKKVIAVYPGRFQPPGKNHAIIFNWVQSKFGKQNSYVVTSNKVEIPKSPFNFSEKKKIWAKHGVSNIVQVKNPYQAIELVSKFDPKTTAVVFIIGDKDSDRLTNSKFYHKWDNKPTVGYKDGAYYLPAPRLAYKLPGYGEISGTVIRRALGDKSKSDKKDLFKNIFGFFDKSIYNLVVGKLEALNEIMNDFSKQLLESSNITKLGKSEVDDGPRHFYGNQKTYRTKTSEMALRLGFEVVNYLIGKEEFEIHDTDFPEGPPQSVTYFPVGLAGVYGVGTNYFKDMKGQPAFHKWSRNIMRIVQSTGFEFITFLGAEKSIESSKDEPTKEGDNLVKENIITEGGSYGHANHFFDDNDMTFSDLKGLIDAGLQGKLDMEDAVQEKQDGQNLMVTFKDGKLKASRNKSQIKKPIDITQLKSMFAGRGELEKSFVYAMGDLEKAILSLNDKQRQKIFKDGKTFMSLEIIYPSTRNVIDYDGAYVSFHGTIDYDENGNKVSEISWDNGRILAGMIKQVNQKNQKHFTIIKQPILKIKQHQDYTNKRSYFFSKLNKLQSEFKLKESDNIGLYHQSWWEKFISDQAKKLKYPISNNVLMGLVKRWAFFDKSYSLNDVKKQIDNDTFKDWVLNFDKADHSAQVKKNMFPFETLTLELGAEILKNAEGFLAANPDKTIQTIRKDLAKAIKQIRSSGDVKDIKILKRELERIKAVGGFSAIVPSEGIMMRFKGKTWKITGIFAPVNTLINLLKYK